MFIKSLLAFHLFTILAIFIYSEIEKHKLSTEFGIYSPDEKKKEKKIERENRIKTMLDIAFVLACIGSCVTLLLTLKGAYDKFGG